MSVATEATEEMLIAYHELNGNVEELDEEPSALDFMRFVAKNRPFVVRRGCLIWPAVRKWNAAYLRKIMGNFPVTVAVTPSGSVFGHTLRTRTLNEDEVMRIQ